MAVRFYILDIIAECFIVLQYFPDDHLPMMHENWRAIRDSLEHKDYHVGARAIQACVSLDIAVTSKYTVFSNKKSAVAGWQEELSYAQKVYMKNL